MVRRWAMAFAATAFLCGGRPAMAGVLDGIRGEVNEESGSDPGGGSSRGGWSCSDDDDDGDSIFAWVAIRVLSSPFVLPIAILGDRYERPAEFPNAPYSANKEGYLLLTDDARGKNWSSRLSIETGGNFDDVALLGGRLQLEHQNRWGLDAAWSNLNEHNGGAWDRLTIGDANIVFRFAQSESAQFYTGLGFNWMADHGSFDAGFNFTYGADWFPLKPMVVSSSIDLGGLGGATLFRSRTTIGAVVNRFEVYSGFEYLNVEGVDLPMGLAGLRVWY